MKIILQKESFLNSIKAVKGIVSTRGVQPILGAILIESVSSDRIKLTTTDLNLSISYTTKAEVEKEGKIAINAKVIEDIITKMPDKNITIELNVETNTIKIQSEKTKFEVISLNAEEFPNILNKKTDETGEEKTFEILTKDLNKAIKQTAFSAVQNEIGGVLTGICFNIE